MISAPGHEGVRWPDDGIQRQYTGAAGQILLARTLDFIELLHSIKVLETSPQWKALDYGAGFGRIASIIGQFVGSSRIDLADAWPASLEIAKRTGIGSKVFLVSPHLETHEFATSEYDLAYAYSIFTHLPSRTFLNNIQTVMNSIKSGGTFVFTVREPKFLSYLEQLGKRRSEDGEMENGFWFGNAQTSFYGDSVVDRDWLVDNLRHLGTVAFLGTLSSEPFQTIVMLTKPD
jgi:hypothetical protein